jgi:monothiol glutaredoxin
VIVSEQQIEQEILDSIAQNRVMLFMKGTPDMPRCGFSAQTVACLRDAGAEFGAMDILPDPRIRQELSALSSWPTIPQLFAHGELVGGCDIVTEMYESGELAETLGVEPAEPEPVEERSVAAQPMGIENRLA